MILYVQVLSIAPLVRPVRVDIAVTPCLHMGTDRFSDFFFKLLF